MAVLSDIERNRFIEFQCHHCGTCYIKAYPGDIGWKIVAACDGCKAELDISDYDSW